MCWGWILTTMNSVSIKLTELSPVLCCLKLIAVVSILNWVDFKIVSVVDVLMIITKNYTGYVVKHMEVLQNKIIRSKVLKVFLKGEFLGALSRMSHCTSQIQNDLERVSRELLRLTKSRSLPDNWHVWACEWVEELWEVKVLGFVGKKKDLACNSGFDRQPVEFSDRGNDVGKT